MSAGVRNAKKNTLKNAVWLPEKTCTKHQQCDTASSQCEPQWGSQLQSKPKSTKKRKNDKDEAVKHKQLRLDAKKSSGHTAQQLTSIKEDQLEQSGSEEAGNHTDSDQTDFASNAKDSSDDSDFEDPTSIAKILSTEIPSFVSSSKAKNPPTPVWANDLMVSESEESCNDSAPKSNGDTSTFISTLTSYQSIGHSEASSMADSQAKSKQPLTKARIVKAESEQDFSDAEDKSDTSSVTSSRSSSRPSRSSSAKLILTEHGKVKMTGQDITTRKVIQGAILKAKAHMTFVNSYPELIEKTSFSHNTLLKAAHNCHATSIETQIKTNDAYASALATLVEAQVPLFRGDLKDNACGQVAAYLRLGSNSIASSKAFIEDHSYHYFMQFSDNNVPKPVWHKPYLGDLMVHLMKGRYFNGPKSVGATFAQNFTNIAKNKANWPEVPIPMVALTSVHSTLLEVSGLSIRSSTSQGTSLVKSMSSMSNSRGSEGKQHLKNSTNLWWTFLPQYRISCTLRRLLPDLTTNALAFLDLDGMEE
ncbi:hypothetical protein EDB19DRAFT_1905865 [Suillus lakei]|nr:hypothetical protein EDB19DRAFT_1905865 [Suillus lakei]